MKHVLIDTNFLLHCIEFHIDIKEELKNVMNESYEVTMIETSEKELKGKKNENVALKWMEKLHVKLIKPPQDTINVDRAIIATATSNTIVATQDKRLKEKLKSRGIAVLVIRQKKYFLIENVL